MDSPAVFWEESVTVDGETYVVTGTDAGVDYRLAGSTRGFGSGWTGPRPDHAALRRSIRIYQGIHRDEQQLETGIARARGLRAQWLEGLVPTAGPAQELATRVTTRRPAGAVWAVLVETLPEATRAALSGLDHQVVEVVATPSGGRVEITSCVIAPRAGSRSGRTSLTISVRGAVDPGSPAAYCAQVVATARWAPAQG